MTLTAKHLERRKKYLGASEIGAVLGIDPYKNALDVYLEKTGQVVPFEGNAATDRGNRLERSVLDWAADELGVKIRANQWRVHTNRVHAATLDAIIPARPTEAIEAKTSRTAGWGEAGTDEVPDKVLLQAQHQMLVADLETVWVPTLQTHLDFVMYRVDRNDDLINIILERGREFWEEHVLAGVPPEGMTPNLEVAKRLRREPESMTPVPDEVVAALLEAEEAERQAKKRREEAQAAFLAAMGDAEAATCSMGTLTYLQQSRTSVDTKRLKAEHPDIYREFSKTSTFRVLRKRLEQREEAA